MLLSFLLFVTHDLKGALKYIGVEICTFLPVTYRDRHSNGTITRVSESVHLQLEQLHRITHFNPTGSALTAFIP
jgi:hypothetical protein